MLHRYDVGNLVNVHDAVILQAALEHYPNATERIGCGITGFSVRTAGFGTKCFWVNRPDGTTEKLSITGAIHGSYAK
ncbi:DCL family protein [Alcaligenes sp. MMA]|uniref:DCL family protein n=1 Tax=Alcaligenes sp. MMA TaxID=2893019 RepID=UPI003FA34A68